MLYIPRVILSNLGWGSESSNVRKNRIWYHALSLLTYPIQNYV
jgi:hypothetical protein